MERSEFSDQYARACEARADTIFEETLEIADDSRGDYTVDEDGHEIVNHENIQRSRLRVDTRKWFVSKLNPKRYGEKLDLNTTVSVSSETIERRSALLQMLLALSDARQNGADLPDEVGTLLDRIRGVPAPVTIEGTATEE